MKNKQPAIKIIYKIIYKKIKNYFSACIVLLKKFTTT